MIQRRLIVLLLLTSFASGLHANEASHRQSAEELVRAMDLERTTLVGVNTMLELQVQQNPMLLPYRDVFQEWAGSFLSWDAMGPQVVDLYVATFTEAELREMTAFYQSPTGQKTLAKMEDLFRQSAEIGRKLAEQHQDELKEMIRQRATELQQTSKPDEASSTPN